MEDEKQQRKSVRDSFAEKFISILESSEPLQWVKGWSSGQFSLPYNGQTERRYNGINRMVLMFKAMEMGWSDPRYYTFKQVFGSFCRCSQNGSLCLGAFPQYQSDL